MHGSEVLPQTIFYCPYTGWELALDQRTGMGIRPHLTSCNIWALLGSWWSSASCSCALKGTEITWSVCAEVFQMFPSCCRAFPPLSPHCDQPYKGHFPFHLAQSPFSLNAGGLFSVPGTNQILLLWERRLTEEKGSQAHLTISDHGSLFSGLPGASGRKSP